VMKPRRVISFANKSDTVEPPGGSWDTNHFAATVYRTATQEAEVDEQTINDPLNRTEIRPGP